MWHSLISPGVGVPDAAGWLAFHRENSQSAVLESLEWEVCGNGSSCGRYEGNPARLACYRKLASDACKLLNEVECPEGGWVQLPKQDGHLGWIEAVYGTARCYATADLRLDYGRWNRTVFPLDDDDHWVADESGAKYPMHPIYERLVSGLFWSSAEAIRLWFDPNLSLRVGECVQETPVAFARPYLFHRTPPQWDGRTLRCEGRPVRTFASQATACICLLDAFQKAEWIKEIDGRFIEGMDGDDARLGDTISRVNKMQNAIQFDRDGNGWVRWYWLGETAMRRAYRGRAKRTERSGGGIAGRHHRGRHGAAT